MKLFVHPGFDLVSSFGAHVFEWNIVKHNHHSLMSKLYDTLCYAKKKIYTMSQPTSSSKLNTSQNGNKTFLAE